MKCLDFEFRKNPMYLVQCSSCNTILVDPIPEKNELAKYYENSYYHKPSFFFNFIQKRRKRFFSNMTPGKVLDVGCGTGNFLETMQQAEWTCSGTEFSTSSKPFLEPLRKKGISIQYGELKQLDFPQDSFDLVTFWHVIEHLQFPQQEIATAHKLIKKNGLLFIAIPNIDSLSFAFWKCNWFHLDLPRHLVLFSPKTITSLLEKNGFEVIRISHFAIEYNPYGVLQSIYNALGFEFNLLTQKIKAQKKNKTLSSKLQLGLVFLSLPLLLPISFLLAYIFSIIGRGDTISVWARKR